MSFDLEKMYRYMKETTPEFPSPVWGWRIRWLVISLPLIYFAFLWGAPIATPAVIDDRPIAASVSPDGEATLEAECDERCERSKRFVKNLRQTTEQIASFNSVVALIMQIAGVLVWVKEALAALGYLVRRPPVPVWRWCGSLELISLAAGAQFVPPQFGVTSLFNITLIPFAWVQAVLLVSVVVNGALAFAADRQSMAAAKGERTGA